MAMAQDTQTSCSCSSHPMQWTMKDFTDELEVESIDWVIGISGEMWKSHGSWHAFQPAYMAFILGMDFS